MFRWLGRLALIAGLGYLLLCAVLYFAQEALIFHPSPLPHDYIFEEGEEIFLSAPDGTRLHMLGFRQDRGEGAAAGAMLYLHGNRGSNKRSLYQTRDLVGLPGMDLYLFDYRGYGKSGGELTGEAQLFADAQLAFDTLAVRYGEQNVIVVGYSLGTGPASYLAAHNRPRHCVLAAPYVSLTAMKNLWFWMVPDFVLKFPLNSRGHVAAANCPVTILHGEGDELIPYGMAKELKEANPRRVKLIPLPGVGHRGVILHEKFDEVVEQIMVGG